MTKKATTTKKTTTKKATTKKAAAKKVVSTKAVSTASKKTYTVKPGDTLAKIAKKTGVSSWQKLYSLNKAQISNPHMIYVGQHFVLN